MTDTPFRDTARELADCSDYLTMSVECDRARSHGWWRNLVEWGPWDGPPNGGRVGPPDREALPGIAKLFGTSVETVAEMIAADWYGVCRDSETSPRVQRLAPLLDQLDDSDAEFVATLVQRLAKSAPAE